MFIQFPIQIKVKKPTLYEVIGQSHLEYAIDLIYVHVFD